MCFMGGMGGSVRTESEASPITTRRHPVAADWDVTALREAAQAEIADGLSACQVAVAKDGHVVWTESFGTATPNSRFLVMSATKPIVSAATLLLIGEGLLDVQQPVAHYIPEFASHGKDVITVEQVMLMTAGFPTAPMTSADGGDPTRRRARFTEWELEYE